MGHLIPTDGREWHLDETARGPHGRLLMLVDVETRLQLAAVSGTQSVASEVAALVRRAIREWGLRPEEIHFDNSRTFAGLPRLLEGLGIKTKIPPPFSPHVKRPAERALSDLSHRWPSR
jgi:hypothetical protein